MHMHMHVCIVVVVQVVVVVVVVSSSSSIYQIPNTEHMAYRLVRSLVYKRGVGIRETVWVGVWFGKTK